MYLLNLLILFLILFNLVLCSYGLYRKVTEKYIDGDEAKNYGEDLLKKFKESENEAYEDEDNSRLMNKFSGEGNTEGYDDYQDKVQKSLSNLYD